MSFSNSQEVFKAKKLAESFFDKQKLIAFKVLEVVKKEAYYLSRPR